MTDIDAASAERIGLTWLRATLAPVGGFGRAYDATRPPYGAHEIEYACDEIAAVVAFAARSEAAGLDRVRAALRAVPEPAAIVARLRAGDVPSDVDFYELARFADALATVRAAYDAAVPAPRRTLDDERAVPTLDALRDVLAAGRTDGNGWYLDDAFDGELRAARNRVAAAEAALDERRTQIADAIRAATGISPAGDEVVVLRDVYDGPAPPGTSVAREAPQYRVFAMTLLAPERDAAAADLARVEEAARTALGARVAASAPAIDDARRALGALDRRLARAAFVARWGGCVPTIDARRFACDDATFVPLAEALGAHARRYTPISFALASSAVLTGPNMGGKSAALATAGFIAACVALGVPPPARTVTLPPLARIVWIGDGETPRERLLSSYAAEVVRAQAVVAGAGAATLVLLDEFARTTGPREGRALLIALIEALGDAGAFSFIATHFEGVAEAAPAHLRIAGLGDALPASAPTLDAALDAINRAMDYRVVPASAGGGASDALALAALLGLDATIVARARALHAGREDGGAAGTGGR